MTEAELDREMDLLEEDLNEGRITQLEFNRELRELQREYRESAQGAARDAYDRELDRW